MDSKVDPYELIVKTVESHDTAKIMAQLEKFQKDVFLKINNMDCLASRPETYDEVFAKLKEYHADIPTEKIHAYFYEATPFVFSVLDRSDKSVKCTATLVQAKKDCHYNYLVHCLHISISLSHK